MIYDIEYVRTALTAFDNVFVIGYSLEKRPIYCVQIGTGKKCAVFAAAFHGLEYMTSAALISFAQKYNHMKDIHKKLRLYIIPMVNPDGVNIAINGIDPKNIYHQSIVKNIGIIDYTKTWQANSAGVDINHNFDADWKSICENPSPTKYGGKFPCSEPETQTVTKILTWLRPELFIAFHSQGKEIYYDFNNMENKGAEETGKAIAASCGYKLCRPTGTAAFGGAKDWYIQEFRKQAFTVELGSGKNPLPNSQLPQMEKDVYNICMTAINKIFL